MESVAASAVRKGAGGRGTLCPGLGRKEKPRGMGTDLKDRKGQLPQRSVDQMTGVLWC